jgi:hypothetical protein
MAQNNQSKATRKYEASHDWVSKTYKMKGDVVKRFAEACNKAGVSQAGQLMKMMEAFIAEQQ